ncbi:GNAT family N-acetyltransferase [Cellvibrio fontiphilus]|uniref:GNAT family N-acetyltransferase n=1 Tax=Cellvibrio fontiphilus TaxID=1815559 RepID=A0ABV7FD48_9GAMM
MTNLVIKQASASDVAAVANLFNLYRQFYEQAPDQTLAQGFIEARIRNNESVILLAEFKGEAVGFCQLYPSFCSVIAAPIYVLYDLFVHPEQRGIGAGKALLLAAEAQAKRAGMKRMDLTTAKTNLTAQSLYESLGWVRDDVFFTYNKHVISE